MKSNLKGFLFAFLIVFGFAFSTKEFNTEAESKIILERFESAVKSIRTLQFTLINHERIGDRLLTGKQKVSLTISPFQCHIVLLEPGKGEEIVYAENKYSNLAIYEPNGFPYLQLELDPYGSLMRKNNHHTIFDLGYGPMLTMLNYHMQRSPYLLSSSSLTMNGKDIQKLTIDFTKFSYNTIIIDKKESISHLANRLMLSDYMLAEINKLELSSNLKPGQQIKVPSAYAKRIVLFMDKENGLPIVQVIYDEKGIYEKYEFSEILVNIPIPEKRFNSEMLGKSL